MSCLYVSKADPTVLRVKTDALIQGLEHIGYIFDRANFVDVLEKYLNEKKPEDLTVDTTGKMIVSVAIYNLSEQLNIDPKKLRDYILSNNTYDMVKNATEELELTFPALKRNNK